MSDPSTSSGRGTGTVLVLNSGSSSLKYQLVHPDTAEVLASGLVERIGESTGSITHKTGTDAFTIGRAFADHGAALVAVEEQFSEHGPDLDSAGIRAVGHRVVHGGPDFSDPVIIDDDVLAEIRNLSALAPLHNPAAVAGIEAARGQFGVPHIAVFDTAFFTGLPAEAATYALPRELAEHNRIRRYGFHGTSHAYVSRTAAEFLGRDLGELNQVVLHLGNGCSASAIRGGRAVDTSMGLTPLQGLVMGTRSGDVDPGLHTYLHNELGMTIPEIDTLLNKQSGVKGLSGVNDFRELQQLVDGGDEHARLALDVYVHRLRHYLGAYAAILGRLDLVVFTAGVGEHSAPVRAAVLADLPVLGIALDPERNEASSGQARVISAENSAVTVLVVPTNEELEIARQALDLVAG
jgi:acetate kinase